MKTQKNTVRFFIVFLQCVLCHLVFAATITTNLNKTQIASDENFEVVFTLQNYTTALQPDLKPLEKDFMILGTGQSQQISIINGVGKSVTQFTVSLSPKRAGSLTIPAINFGKFQSQEKQISVKTPENLAKSGHPPSTLLDASVDTHNPYVQAEVVYTIKLYYSRGLSHGALTAPKVDDAVMIRLGKDKHYQEKYHGQPYQVVERNYALFPQHHGKLTIQPPTFTGLEPHSDHYYSRQNSFMDLTPGRRIRLAAPKIALDVKPIPNNARHIDWLPASDIQLTQSWSGLKNVKIGEPITRNITIRVTGLTAEQLPDLNVAQIPGLSNYTDRATNMNNSSGDHVVGERTVKIAYIPKQGGVITIPQIKFDWFNTKTHRLATAVLPGQQLKLNGIKQHTVQDTPQQSISQKPQSTLEQIQKPVETNDKFSFINSVLHASSWFYLACALLFAWATTLFVLWRGKQHKAPMSAEAIDAQDLLKKNLNAIKTEFKKSCASNDPKAMREVLLRWGKLRYPEKEIHSLGELANHVTTDELITSLHELEAALYSSASGKEAWDPMKLWRAFLDEQNVSDEQAEEKSVLPPLYPE